MTRKWVIYSAAYCGRCDIKKVSRNAEAWAKKHAKENTLHQVFFTKEWQIDAPLRVNLTTKKG